MYHLDRENDVVKQLIKLDMALSRKTMENAVQEYQKPIAVKSSYYFMSHVGTQFIACKCPVLDKGHVRYLHTLICTLSIILRLSS